MIGTLLQNRYRLDAELGHGGMGTVYRAHDTLLDRDVAVKILNDAGLGTEGRARLLREAQAVARLNHPNIVAVYDAGEVSPAAAPGAGGTPFIVMELVEGSSLRECPPQTLEETLKIAQQLCAALEHAHTHGIVHRDLKPENVLVADRHAKLMDFGLARTFDSRLTTEGMIVGTVSYLAPEQALGQAIDGRSDLYALGVMLYELIAGRLPFTAEDAIGVISQHLYAPVVPPSTYNSAILPGLDALITRLLNKSPDDRPASAAEVHQALETIGQPATIAPSNYRTDELSLLARIARGRFVARQHEMAEAQRLWQQAVQGEGHVLLISGEPGVGKTRFARELMARAQVTGATVLVGECFAEGAAPYAPLAQVIQTAFTLTPATRPLQGVSLREKETALPSPGGRGVGGEGEIPASILADLITIAPALRATYPDVSPNLLLEPQAERQRIFDSVAAFFALLSERAPILLFIDDVQWADSGSLFLLHHLARRARNLRVLIVLTYREVELSEARPLHEMLLDLNRERLATRLKLSRFDRDQTCDLLAALFQEEITPEFLDGIYGETDGNPFFVEEVCKALIEAGKLTREGGRWRRPGMDQIEIPQSVRVAIELRVAKLPAPAQDTLRAAAILGREFEFEVLRAMDGLGEDALIDALEIAERAQLIGTIKRSGAVSFAFAHALIPLTLHEGLSALRRQRLHRRAAQAIEHVHADRLPTGDFAAALGRHYAEAGDLEKAIEYYTQAGERARGVYAYHEAIDHYRHALASLKEIGPAELTRAARTAMTLGQLYHTVFDFERSQQAYQEGFALWQRVEEEQRKVILPPAPHALRKYEFDFATLDLTMTNDVPSGELIYQLFSGLVELTPNLDLAPDLARHWEVSEDGRRYVFHLRPDARWSDGMPVTAHDFEYAWKRALSPIVYSPHKELFLSLRGARDYHEGQLTAEAVGVNAVDDLTLVVELEEPIGHFLYLLATYANFAIPRHAVEVYGEEWSLPEHIVTNGPFRLDMWRRGEAVVLVRNSTYHGRFGGNLARIELDLWQRAGDPLASYELDQHDVDEVTSGAFEQAQRRYLHEFVTLPAAIIRYLSFNTTRPPFDDARVRQALTHALDRQVLADVVLNGVDLPATGGLVPPGLPGHVAGLGLSYDPERARRLLAEAGYPEGRGFPTIEAWEGHFVDLRPLVNFLASQWHDQLGIHVNWKHLERADFLKRLRVEPPPIFVLGWIAECPDPDEFLRQLMHRPAIRWRHQDYEQLLETARRSADQAERLKFYAAADRLLAQEAPVIPLYYERQHYLLKPWVKQYPITPFRADYWKDVIIEAH